MYPWNILAIPPSHNKKDIKRAYAKKLKTVRPDDDSQAFQELHRAYKEALHLADSPHHFHHDSPNDLVQDSMAEAQVTSNESDHTKAVPSILKIEKISNSDTQNHTEEQRSSYSQAPLQNITTIENHPVDQIESNGSVDINEVIQKQEVEKQLTAKILSIIQRNEALNNIDTWQFLLDSPFILDGAFNWNVGIETFKYIAEHNAHSSKTNVENTQQFKPDTLIFFDSIFSWNHNQAYLYEAFGHEFCDTILISITNDQNSDNPISRLKDNIVIEEKKTKPKKNIDSSKEYYFGHLLIRSLALIIDFLLIFFPVFLFLRSPLTRELSNSAQDAMVLAILCAIPLYFFIALILESSPWQATPGKKLLGLRVTNRNFEKIGFFHNILRIIFFFITVPFGKIAWIINCFLGGNLLHDRLSRSYVINIRKV